MMRQFRHNPEYYCCDVSAIFLPLGQVLISGQLHAQVICCNCITEDFILGLCPLLQDMEQRSQKLQPTGIVGFGSHHSYFYVLSVFCSSRGAAMELHCYFFFLSVLGFLLETSCSATTRWWVQIKAEFGSLFLVFSPECSNVSAELLLPLSLLITSFLGFPLHICLESPFFQYLGTEVLQAKKLMLYPVWE